MITVFLRYKSNYYGLSIKPNGPNLFQQSKNNEGRIK